MPLLACQKLLKTQGLSHETLAQCTPLIDTIPSQAVRREFVGYLQYQLETAQTLVSTRLACRSAPMPSNRCSGWPSNTGWAQTQDAARIALRLPAFCGLPTREEAEQVLAVSVARQHEVSGQVISLTKQRREVLDTQSVLSV